MLTIRPATLADLPAITEIYNDAIINTRNTFDTIPKDIAERTAWYHHHMPDYPILVADVGGEVVGFASVSPWSDRPAYGRTVTSSVYIRLDRRGQGIGKKLLPELLDAAYAAGYHTIMGSIYAGNDVSRRLFESAGFRVVGRLQEVGYKFEEWLDVYLVQHIREPGQPLVGQLFGY